MTSWNIGSEPGKYGKTIFRAVGDGKVLALSAYKVGDDKARRSVAEEWAEIPALRNPSFQSASDFEQELREAESRAVDEAGIAADCKETQADLIIALAEKHYRIGQSTTGEPFAVAKDGPNLAVMFNGSKSALKAALSCLYRETYGKVANASALSDAICALAGAAQDAEPEVVGLRLATYGGGVVIDLCDTKGKAVHVTPTGWRVLDRSPVLFHRTALSAAMPVPIREAGGLDRLRDLLNVTDDDWSLLVGYLVCVFFPAIAHPVLLIGGQQGVGKSTSSRLIVESVDPSTCPLRSDPKNVESWTLAAAGSWAVCLDNLSEIKDWLSDAICRAATGDGLVKRKLYTGGELDVWAFRRCVILNSIDAGAMRGDLGERLLLIELQPIDPEHRRTDAEINKLFSRDRAAILGGLLDVVAAVMAKLPHVQIDGMSRMADFDRLLAAVDLVRGTDARAVYVRSTAAIAGAVVESDPVSEAIKAHFEKTPAVGRLEGNSAKLLRELSPSDDPKKLPKDWPANARAFAGRLRRLIPALASVGVVVEPPAASGGSRIYTIYLKVSEVYRPTAGIPAGDSANAEKQAAAVDKAYRPTAGPTAAYDPDDEPTDTGGNGQHNYVPAGAAWLGGER